MKIDIKNVDDMHALGVRLGAALRGGEIIVLIGDIGAGKTTLTKGIACGLGIDADVQSPTFTLNRIYEARDGLELAHYDFYRLSDPGIMALELAERVRDPRSITVIEWAQAVADVVPDDYLAVKIQAVGENERLLACEARGESACRILESI